MQREGDKVFIRYRDLQGQPQEIPVDYVLAATGRRPNVDRLGLENTGLQLDARGVPLADRLTMQTSVPHIFIAGDASNQLPLLHEASDGHASPVPTPAASRRSIRACDAARFRWCSPIRRSPWSAQPSAS